MNKGEKTKKTGSVYQQAEKRIKNAKRKNPTKLERKNNEKKK